MLEKKQFTRRQFLWRSAALATAGILMTACGTPQTPVSPTVIVPPISPQPPNAIPAGSGEKSKLVDSDLESFASNTLYKIFDTAYSTNPSVSAHKVSNSVKIEWANQDKEKMRQSFNTGFSAVFQNAASPVAQAIRFKAEQLRENSRKNVSPPGNWLFKKVGSPHPTSDYWYALKAIKLVYEEKGYAVEYRPELDPPTMAIFRKDNVNKTEGIDEVLSVKIFDGATKYFIQDADLQASIFDSRVLLGYQVGVEAAYEFDDKEYFVREQGIKTIAHELRELASQQNVRVGENETSPSNNAQLGIRMAASNMARDIIGTSIDPEKIVTEMVDVHARMHLADPGTSGGGISMLESEKRSYTAQFATGIPNVARLSLAHYLYLVSQKQFSDKVLSNTYYDPKSNYPDLGVLYPGIPETLDNIIRVVTNDLKGDSGLRKKLQLDDPNTPSNKEQSVGKNTILPCSNYTSEYVVFVLSRLDKLTDDEINKIAGKIFNQNPKWFWFEQKPVIGVDTSLRGIFHQAFTPLKDVMQTLLVN